jgi:hypothetical protein
VYCALQSLCHLSLQGGGLFRVNGHMYIPDFTAAVPAYDHISLHTSILSAVNTLTKAITTF